MPAPRINLGDCLYRNCMQYVYFFPYTGLIVGNFPFRFSNVLNLKESSTLLLSETRLHGKQDKPEGSKHMKNGKETESKQSGRKFS